MTLRQSTKSDFAMQILKKAAGSWHIDSDEIFDVWSGSNLDNGFFYHRFSGVRREIQKHSAGGKGFSFILLWKYLLFWRNCQHFDFATCCFLASDFTSDCSGASDPQKKKDLPFKKCKSVCYLSIRSGTGVRILVLYFKTSKQQ